MAGTAESIEDKASKEQVAKDRLFLKPLVGEKGTNVITMFTVADATAAARTMR